MNSLEVTQSPRVAGGELPVVGGGAERAALEEEALQLSIELKEGCFEITSSPGTQRPR